MADLSTSQFLRIATSQKLDDRFLTVLHLLPEDEQEAKKGELFVIIEITRPWYPTSQIGARIIKTFQQAYYLSNSSSNIVNFEEAVKKVNEILTNLVEQGETDWIGKTNAVLGLVVENDIHLSSTGLAKAYLVRSDKLSLITEEDKEGEIHPAKTFSSITSGNLAQNDFVAVGNSAFFEAIDLTTVKALAQKESAYQSGLECVRMLKKIKINTANGLFIKKATAGSEPEVVYVDSAIPSGFDIKKSWSQSVLPFLSKIFDAGKKGARSGYKISQEKIYPMLKSSTQTAAQKTKKGLQTGWGKASPFIKKHSEIISSKIESSITGIKNIKGKSDNASESISADPSESIIGKTIYTIHDYKQQQKAQKNNLFSNLLNSIAKSIRIFYLKTKTALLGLLTKRKKPQLLALGAILLIIILIISISLQKNKQINQRVTGEQNSTLEDAKKKVEDGKNALAFGDKKEAQILFGNAIAQAQTLKDSPLFNEASQVVESAQSEYDKLTSTKRFQNINPLVAGIDASFLEIIQGQAIAISLNGQIIESGVTQGAVPENKSSLDKEIIDVALIGDGLVVALTKDQKIFRYNPNNDSVSELIASGNELFAKGSAIETFANNVYILDPSANQIWRYKGQDLAYSSGEKFIPRSQVSLSKAQDIEIDGSVYVLDSAGKATKLTRGEKESFDLSSIPLPFDKMNDPTQIFTDTDATSIFVLDRGNQRLLEFDKNGLYSHQYILPVDKDKISDIAIIPKSRVAYLLADKNIYQLDL